MPFDQKSDKARKSESSYQVATPQLNPYPADLSGIVQRTAIDPALLSHEDVFQLQSMIGNDALLQLYAEAMNSNNESDAPLQRKISATKEGLVYDNTQQAYQALRSTFEDVDRRILMAVLDQMMAEDIAYHNFVNLKYEIEKRVSSTPLQSVQGNTTLVWESERLEADVTSNNNDYTFHMSYKHLMDTYINVNRGFGQKNLGDKAGNTLLALSDSTFGAKFKNLVTHIKTNIMDTSLQSPHVFGKGFGVTHDGITYVVEGTQSVHAYPTAGGDTVNFGNDAYDALVVYSIWRKEQASALKRGEMLSKKENVIGAAAQINRFFPGDNVPNLVNQAQKDHIVAFYGNEVQRITGDFNALTANVGELRKQFNQVIFQKSIQKTIAEGAINKAEQVLGENTLLLNALNIDTLCVRFNSNAMTEQQLKDETKKAIIALNKIREAYRSALTNYNGALNEDAKKEEEVEQVGFGFNFEEEEAEES